MSLFSSKYLTKTNYLNLLFAAIPISFIAGNMIININILLLILSTFFIYWREIFKIKYYFLDKFIFLSFLFILFTGFYNEYHFHLMELTWKGPFTTIMKSFFYLKYLALYLVLRFLIEKDNISLKPFFITCSIFSLFVCFDLFFQLYFGQDIFGFKSTGRKLSGPFGDELIAGGYVQRFSLFAFFLFPIFFKTETEKMIKFLIPLLFIIFFSGIIISGNRMPLILFLFTFFLVIIFQKQTRRYLFSFLATFVIIFLILFSFNKEIRINYLDFKAKIVRVYENLSSDQKNIQDDGKNYYYWEFASFYDTWKLNKYIGGGIKNFRYYCHHRPNKENYPNFTCNMHPHNYYFEILTETGLIGFIIISIIFLNILYISFFKKYFSNSNLRDNHLITPFIFLFITEIFPIKSTGSFFTTGNSTYIFLIIAIIVALTRKQNLS